MQRWTALTASVFLLGCGSGFDSGQGGAGTAASGAGSSGHGGAASSGAAGTGGSASSGSAGTGGAAATGSTTSGSTASSSGSASSSSGSAGSSSGGITSTPGLVDCGTTTCQTLGGVTSVAQKCCLGGPAGPVCSITDCPVGDTAFACDQSADCANSQICCFEGFNTANHYEEGRCSATGTQPCMYQLCGTDAECKSPLSCVSQSCYGQTVQTCGPLPATLCP